ncbi:Uncharacterised protein [Klebsiella aerogenes]|nr:Uncharacterised protein [Klebsiella aerogenes]
MHAAGVDQPQQHLGVHRCIAFAIPGGILQQRDGVRHIGGASLTVHQHPRQNDLPGFTADLDGFFRQLAGLRIVRLLRVANFELRQQRQCIAIALGGGLLRPVFGFLIITGADPGIGKVILRASIAGFRLLLILAARFGGDRCAAGENK